MWLIKYKKTLLLTKQRFLDPTSIKRVNQTKSFHCLQAR